MASIEAVTSKELLEAQHHLWLHIFSFINSLSLKCAVELGIPDAVHDHGKPITLTELATALSIPAVRVPNFQRFMRLLVHSGFFTVTTNEANEDVYALTTNSIPLISKRGASIIPFIELMLDESLMFPWQSLSSWFKTEEPSTAFEMAHKKFIWEATGTMPDFGRKIREGLGSDSSVVTKVIIEDGGHLFHGAKTLVEVAGVKGTMAQAIADAFPELKCTVLDLPHMIDALEEKSDKIAYVGGNMFEYIPPADMLILKWVCHCWSDEACVTLLKRCKEAIPTKEKGGKVIIIDKVMDTKVVNPKLMEIQLHFDIHMMVHTTGKQRTEDEWRKLFTEAGFKGYKILPALGLRSIIEIYH